MPVYLIAEVAQAHDGSLGMAHAFIDAVAKTGADAIKFQTHIAHAESTPNEAFRVPFSYQDANRYDYWKRMEWSAEQWQRLKDHAEEKGLSFLSSPFSLEAFELLEKLGVSAWKIGSGEIRSRYLLEKIVQTRKPSFISTGMSSFAEIDEVVQLLHHHSTPFTLMQCMTQYPCPPEKVGLNLLAEFKARYQCQVGLSDHSGSIFPSLAAASLGASALEVHVTFNKQMFGPDTASSVSINELTELVRGVRMIETMLSHPVNKNAVATELKGLQRLFGKSAVCERDLSTGTTISKSDVSFKKPASGILEWDFEPFIGKPLQRPIKRGEFIRPEDFKL